jgi:hypothetical protein
LACEAASEETSLKLEYAPFRRRTPGTLPLLENCFQRMEKQSGFEAGALDAGPEGSETVPDEDAILDSGIAN